MNLIAALGITDDIVHAIFSDNTKEQGFYMTRRTYNGSNTHGGPREGCRTPEDFSAHGLLVPAPTDFDYWYQGIKEMIK